MNEQLMRDLGSFGLSEVEAQVYLAALSLGGSFGGIIAKRAGVPRTNCYYVLNSLAEQGLINRTDRDGRCYYLPTTPRKLLSDSTSRLELARQLVPSLLELENTAKAKAPQVRYFDTAEASRDVLFGSLESTTEILRYTNILQLRNTFPGELREYGRLLAAKAIRTRIISPFHKAIESFVEDTFPPDYIRQMIQVLYVNPREFSLENEILIYDDFVCIISLDPDEHSAVSIRSQVYADTSRTTFELAWLGATRFEVR